MAMSNHNIPSSQIGLKPKAITLRGQRRSYATSRRPGRGNNKGQCAQITYAVVQSAGNRKGHYSHRLQLSRVKTSP